MKTNRLILALSLAALGLNATHATAQVPVTAAAPAAAPVPDAATIAREKAAAEAARAAAAAAATNPPGRTLPRPIVPPPTIATPTGADGGAAVPAGPGATRPPFPTLPVPGARNTNRPGIQFTPTTPAGVTAGAGGAGPAPPPALGAIAPGAGGAGAAGVGTNLTPAQLRALAATNAAGAATEEVFPPGLIKFQDADINPVLDIYQELTGRTLIKAGTLPQVKISVKSQTTLTRSEAINMLDTILAMNNIATTFQGTKFIKVVPSPQAAQEAEKFNDIPWDLLPEASKIVTHIVQLKNALPTEVQAIIQPFAKLPQSIIAIPSTSMIVLRDYAENVKRMLEMIEKVDVVPVQEFVDVVIPIKYALVTDIANAIGQLTAGGGVAGSIGQQTARPGLSTAGRSPGGFGGGAGGLGGGAYPGAPGYNPLNPQGALGGTGSTLGGGAAGGRGSFAQRLNQIVNRAAGTAGGGGDIYVLGQTKIIPDERTNSLLIFASRQDLVTISNIISKLDVVLAQVLIEAVVMEVTLNNNLDYGINYVQNKPTEVGDFVGGGAIKTIPFLNLGSVFGGGTSGQGSNNLGDGFTYVARFMNLDVAVTAIAGDGRGKVLQRPRIQTSHAVEAHLFVGQSRPYPSSYSGGGGLYGAYNQIQQLQIGVTLSVLPLINADGLVVMDIIQKVESYDGDVDIANVGKVPITSQKEANAKVAVRDRETVMLGGFISNQKNDTHGGVPILKDIPVFGNLFRSTKVTEDRRELIVLIRPTVLPTPDQAALFAKQERERMPATKEAEHDFNEAERKLLDDTNKRLEKKSGTDIYKREGFTR